MFSLDFHKSGLESLYLIMDSPWLDIFLLIILPLYPNSVEGFVYSVNLIAYTQATKFNYYMYWILFVALIAIGVMKIILTKIEWEKGHKILTGISMLLSIFAVLFLAMTREAYAITVTFILLVIKGMVLLKYSRASS